MGSLFPEYSFLALSVAIVNEVWRQVGGRDPQTVRDSVK